MWSSLSWLSRLSILVTLCEGVTHVTGLMALLRGLSCGRVRWRAGLALLVKWQGRGILAHSKEDMSYQRLSDRALSSPPWRSAAESSWQQVRS